jgi:hypothetical protein
VWNFTQTPLRDSRRSRWCSLNLLLNQQVCHENFDDASYYGDKMYKEQANILFYRYRRLIDRSVLCSNLLWVMSNDMSSHLLLFSLDEYFHSYGCTSFYTLYFFFSIILNCRMINGKKPMFLYTFALQLLRILSSEIASPWNIQQA